MRPSRIYPSLPEPPFSANLYVRPSQNLPLPFRIYPSFQQLFAPSQNLPPLSKYTPLSTTIYDHPIIYPLSLRIYPPPPFNNLMRHTQYQPPLLEYSTLFNKFICATLPESTLPPRIYPPPSFSNYMRHSQNLHPPLSKYTPPSSTTICDIPRIYPQSLHIGGSHNIIL